MAHPTFAILHVGYGPELTFLEYLYRVLLHLLVIGGAAVLGLRWSDVTGAVRSQLFGRSDREENDGGGRRPS